MFKFFIDYRQRLAVTPLVLLIRMLLLLHNHLNVWGMVRLLGTRRIEIVEQLKGLRLSARDNWTHLNVRHVLMRGWRVCWRPLTSGLWSLMVLLVLARRGSCGGCRGRLRQILNLLLGIFMVHSHKLGLGCVVLMRRLRVERQMHRNVL